MPKMLDKKVTLKKTVQICTNFGTLSLHVILFSISARILMNSSFFYTTTFNPMLFLSSEQIRDLQRFQEGIILPSCIIPGYQLKFNFRNRRQESNYCSTIKIIFKLLISIDQNDYWC